jgi:hypothetical protein
MDDRIDSPLDAKRKHRYEILMNCTFRTSTYPGTAAEIGLVALSDQGLPQRGESRAEVTITLGDMTTAPLSLWEAKVGTAEAPSLTS